MTERPPFEAAHNCICAFADISILEFYQRYFDTVYIMLHPFYKEDEYGKVTQLVTWKEFVSLAGFRDIAQLDIALRNSIRGLKKKWENEEDVETLMRTAHKHNIRMPSEGEFQDALKKDMLIGLQEQRHHYLFIGDEFGFERKVTYIQDLIEGKDQVTLTYGGHEVWYTNHSEILYASHWDSHFTMLCSNRKIVESILSKHPFEGFYCNEHTEIYWSLQDKEV
ncbi:DUF2711 family protein [Mucilaginibacter sp. Bleaf8]|uniref:DUF2711 family protein n=1 Tax=Mucilaginibacter sp. Bleaf8 TaxID=2834430 RepID=UPI001BCC0C60|nr:DUF2711 family protein [Mucilaginibacter sp. Bleaf8]MBS7565767.1 DUF2711 family protein [Mucilaginibacter sp. Bleaf8]